MKDLLKDLLKNLVKELVEGPLQIVFLIAKNELRMLLRSRRTMFSTFALPLLVWPIVAFLSHLGARAYEANPETTVTISYLGPAAEALAQAATEHCLRTGVSVFASPAASDSDADSLIRSGADVVLDTSNGRVELYERFDLERSRLGADVFEGCLELVRADQKTELLSQVVAPGPWPAVLNRELVDTSSPGMANRRFLGSLLPLVFLGFVLSGGSLVAFSTLAGERESGTLETLLSSSARRVEIVTGKALAVFVLAISVAALQIGNMGIWLRVARPSSSSDVQAVSPLLDASTLLGLALLLMPLALLVSSLLLVLSCHARSYREAQQMFYPLLTLTAIPALLGYWPETEGTLWPSFVPIGNTTIAVKDLVIGQLSGLRLALNVGFNLALTGALLFYSSWALAREGAMLASPQDRFGNSTRGRTLARTLPTVALLWLVSGWFRSRAVSGTDSWPAWVYAIMLFVSALSLSPDGRFFNDVRVGFNRIASPKRILEFALLVASGSALAFALRPLSSSWWPTSSSSLGSLSLELLLALVVAFTTEELFFRKTLLRIHPDRRFTSALSVGCFCLFAPTDSLMLASILAIALTTVAAATRSTLYVIVMRIAFELTPFVAGLLSESR